MAITKRTSSEGALANSMTDLMTSLAVVFILLLVAYLNQAFMENKRRAERYKQLIGHSRTVKSDLIAMFRSLSIEATADPKDPLAIIIPISEAKIQFDPGKAVIKSGGKKCLRDFVPQLSSVISSSDFKDEVESVLIEGHTDSDARDPRKADEVNLPLSQERAHAVLMCVLNDCGLTGDKREHLLDCVSANGRGMRHPILDSSGREDKSASRRVVFKIRVKSVEQKRILLG